MKAGYFLGVSLLGVLSSSAMANDTYLALGDSIAFGYTHLDYSYSNADRGYVSIVADRIGALQGTRPDVINYAIAGETSSSFFDTTNPYRIGNTNYTSVVSQDSAMLSTISSRLAAGDTINHVSLAFGANDLLQLFDSPTFQASDDMTKNLLLGTAIGNVTMKYTAVLTQLRTLLPTAQILLPGFYNPYPASAGPISDMGDAAVGALNMFINAQAQAFGGTYVDFMTPMAGHQLEYTTIALGDVHPNALGYQVLGNAAAAKVTATPEPLTLGFVGLAAVAVRRRMKKSA